MRYAIVSDLHANWQAWNAVLQDICDHQVDSILCLGDVVGYGPRPEEVLTGMRQCTPNFVIGNHDAAACGLLDPGLFNDHARGVVEWTKQHLSKSSLEFLSKIPLTIETEDILFVHAEVAQPGRFGYIDSEEKALHQFMFTNASVVFVGHTHKPLAYSFNEESIRSLPDRDFQLAPGHRYLINPGSAGDPRSSDDVRASYVIYDSARRSVYFRKILFDVEAYRRDLVETGLQIAPYFLRIIDHEASLGRNVFDSIDDVTMSVPEKPAFTGLAKGTYTQQAFALPAAAQSMGTVAAGPRHQTAAPDQAAPAPRVRTNPAPRTGPRSGGSLPKPAAPKNFLGTFLIILLAILIGSIAGFWIIFKM